MAHVVAISNQKGGVGKTTTSYSLGACLAEMGKRVLVVDLDPQANLTLAAGLDFDELESTLVDLITPDNHPDDHRHKVIRATKMSGMDILPADPRLAQVERVLYEVDRYEETLGNVLQYWADQYDYIVLDCPPTLSSLTIIAFSAAQSALIPVQCEYYAAKGLNLLLTIISKVEERSGRPIAWNLVATLYDPRNKIHRTVLDQIRGSFPDRLLDTVIRLDTRLRECPIFGEPIIMYSPRTRASVQYRQLAAEFDARVRSI